MYFSPVLLGFKKTADKYILEPLFISNMIYVMDSPIMQLG